MDKAVLITNATDQVSCPKGSSSLGHVAAIRWARHFGDERHFAGEPAILSSTTTPNLGLMAKWAGITDIVNTGENVVYTEQYPEGYWVIKTKDVAGKFYYYTVFTDIELAQQVAGEIGAYIMFVTQNGVQEAL